MGLPSGSCNGVHVFRQVRCCSARLAFVALGTPCFFCACRPAGRWLPWWSWLKLTPCSILPALAFSLDMFSKTGSSYGVNEVLLASVLGSVVFAMLAAQPLVIVGVTGAS